MKTLCVLTRNPFTKSSGRKAVLRTIISSLERSGSEVDIAIFDEPGVTKHEGDAFWLKSPSLVQVAFNAAKDFLIGRKSLNECLYWSPAANKQLQKIAGEKQYDLVIADTVRTAAYASTIGERWHLDVDDLLSNRYARFGGSGDTDMILGFYGERIPKFLRPIVGWMAGIAVRRESKVIEQREQFWAHRADSVSMVSATEAKILSKRCHREIHVLPMAIGVPDEPLTKPASRKIRTAVFVGGLDYQPNLDAIRHYRTSIYPRLQEAGMEDFTLEVIGRVPEAVEKELSGPGIYFHSYVENLLGALMDHYVFLSPLVSGETGVKTKSLEALAFGVPLITSDYGVSGLDVRHGEHCMVANHPDEFVSAILGIESDPELFTSLVENSHEYVKNNFSLEVLENKWGEVARIEKSISTEKTTEKTSKKPRRLVPRRTRQAI